MELNERQFIAGFNSGYLLAQHEPEMLTALLSQLRPLNSCISGMSWGQKEYELEQTKSNLNELDQLRLKNRKTNDKEID